MTLKLPLPPRLRHEARLLLNIGFPVMVGNLLQVSMSFVDTVMAGNLSAQDLAAVAVGSSLLMPVFIFSIGILMGISPIVAQHFGARRLDQIGPTARHGLILGALLGIPTMLILWYVEPVTRWMSVDPELIPKTLGYAKAASYGMIPVNIYLALRYFNEGLGNTKPAMWIPFIGLLFNIGANWVLMYGKFGFPALGAVGTGYATALTMGVMCVAMVVYTWRKADFARYRVFALRSRLERRVIGEVARVGLPIGMSMGMEVTMFAVVALMMSSLGTMEVAAHQIGMNFASVTFMIAFGIASGITVRVGQVFGRSGLADARYSGWTGIGLATVFMTGTALFMFIAPDLILSMYTQDQALIDRARVLLYLAAVFQLSDGLQVSGSGALRGLKDTTIPMFVNFLSYWVIGLPLGWYLGLKAGYGPEGLWMGLIAGLTTAGLLHNLRFHLITRPHRTG